MDGSLNIVKHILRLVIAVAITLSIGLPSTGHAGEKSPTEQVNPQSLSLTLSYPGVSGTDYARPDRTVSLMCDDPGGTHPNAAQACEDLESTNGQIEQPSSDAICVELYEPVTASASGKWQGREISFNNQYGNTCLMHAMTGQIFSF